MRFQELQEGKKQGAPPNYGNPLELTVSGPNSALPSPGPLPASPCFSTVAALCSGERVVCAEWALEGDL